MLSKNKPTKMKRLLITGGTGFIGRNLCEKLIKHKVYSPTSMGLNLLDKKSVDSFFKMHKIDVVIHTALYAGPQKKEFAADTIRKNLAMFFNLINNKASFKKMIFLGSGAEYNKTRNIVNIREEDFEESIPEDDYGMFKYTISKYAEEVNNILDLRLFGVYGKYEDYTRRFISNAICQSICGLPITVRQNVFFDYLFVDDLVGVIDHFVSNNGKYKVYNVGRGKRTDLVSIAKIVKQVTKNKFDIEILNPGLANEYTCNNSRLLKEYKNFEFTSLEKSIELLTDWYMKRKSELKVNDLIVK